MPNEAPLPVDTVQDLIVNALRDGGILGEDEQPEPTMITRAFRQANFLLTEWQRNRSLIYHLVDYPLLSTGATKYTVGLGGNININPRPDRIESAFLRLNPTQPQPVDLPLDIIPSMEDYNRIAIKNLGVNPGGVGSTIAWRIFYDPALPMGILRPWPIPQASIYEMHVTFKETLARFQGLLDRINLPPEYEPALNWNLAERYREIYQLPASEMVTRFAKASLNAIRLANVAVPTLTIPGAVRTRTRAYDYRSDSP